MNDFESLKQGSYNLIAEFIEKNPAEVATPAVIDVIEKLLNARICKWMFLLIKRQLKFSMILLIKLMNSFIQLLFRLFLFFLAFDNKV